MNRIRQAAVAGSFYPADTGELSHDVQRLLNSVHAESGPAPRALVVPHAGYMYSGPIAATAYARLWPLRKKFHRVLLLGPSHRIAVRGMAVSSADYFRSPLGDVPLDRESIAKIDHPDLVVADDAHRYEHSLEVQLPFLQCVFDSFTLIPIVIGGADPHSVSELIDPFWDDPETLVVISTDLSHYLDYRTARLKDRETCDAIEALEESRISHSDACGATGLRGLMIAAGRRGMHMQTLDLRNSGDIAGSRDQVVGYGAWMVVKEPS